MTPQELEAIGKRMLDIVGGGTLTIERRGQQPRAERARAYRIEEEKRLWTIKLYQERAEHETSPQK